MVYEHKEMKAQIPWSPVSCGHENRRRQIIKQKITHPAWNPVLCRVVEIADDVTTASDVRIAKIRRVRRLIHVIAAIAYVIIWTGIVTFVYAALCTPWLSGV